MQQAARMPSMANTARNLLLNQRVSLDSPFISLDVWKANDASPVEFEGPVYAGLDLSARTDLTALVLIGQVDGMWCVQPYFWTPKTGVQERERRDRAPYMTWVQQGCLRVCDGAAIDYEQVANDMAEILSDVDIQAIAFDRWRIDVLRREFDRIGLDLPLVEWGQGFKDMSPALDALEVALLNSDVAHGNHPVLTWCAANATTTKDPAGNRKLDKSRPTGRIDGIQALAMAFGVASRTESVQGVPDEIFFI